VRLVSFEQEKETYWHLNMAVISCTITSLLIVYFSFHFKPLHYMLRCFYKNTLPELENTSSISPSNTPTSEYTKTAKEMDLQKRKHYIHSVPIASGEIIHAAASDVHSSASSQSAVPSPISADTRKRAGQCRLFSIYLSDCRPQPE
jgi:hypothetical protein